MNLTKIQFSTDEMELVRNADWILTKQAIIQKMVEWLGALSGEMKQTLDAFSLSELANAHPPKISKGENYKGLPYVILDYPRLFGLQDVFAIRTMFWWAHYCSITLHLKGKWQQQYAGAIWKNRQLLADAGFYLCIVNEEWEHAITPENFILLRDVDTETADLFFKHPFLKITLPLHPDLWNDLDAWLMNTVHVLLESLKD